MAPGVGEIGPVKLDGLPFAFKRDLLSHEAHRHPYLELFGAICLVKLSCGGGFGSRANSSLRLLAVLTLMPWLKKYRSRIEANAGDTERSLGEQDASFVHLLQDENADLKRQVEELTKRLKSTGLKSESDAEIEPEEM